MALTMLYVLYPNEKPPNESKFRVTSRLINGFQ